MYEIFFFFKWTHIFCHWSFFFFATAAMNRSADRSTVGRRRRRFGRIIPTWSNPEGCTHICPRVQWLDKAAIVARSPHTKQVLVLSFSLSLFLSLFLSFFLSSFGWKKKKSFNNETRREEMKDRRGIVSRGRLYAYLFWAFFFRRAFFSNSLHFVVVCCCRRWMLISPSCPPPRSLTAIRHLSAAAAPPHPIQFLSLRRLIDCGRCSRWIGSAAPTLGHFFFFFAAFCFRHLSYRSNDARTKKQREKEGRREERFGWVENDRIFIVQGLDVSVSRLNDVWTDYARDHLVQHFFCLATPLSWKCFQLGIVWIHFFSIIFGFPRIENCVSLLNTKWIRWLFCSC